MDVPDPAPDPENGVAAVLRRASSHKLSEWAEALVRGLAAPMPEEPDPRARADWHAAYDYARAHLADIRAELARREAAARIAPPTPLVKRKRA